MILNTNTGGCEVPQPSNEETAAAPLADVPAGNTVQFNLTPLETITPSQGPTEPPGETGVTGLKGERGLEVNHVRSYRIHLYKSRFKGRNHKIQQMYDYKHILMQLPKIFGIRYLRLNGDRKMIRLDCLRVSGL